MKKLLLALMIIGLSSCYVLPEIDDWLIPMEFADEEEAYDYVKRIEYNHDATNWRTPEETYKENKGACADVSLLLVHILHEKLNMSNVYVVTGKYDGIAHTWTLINGVQFEPQTGLPIVAEHYSPIVKKLTYRQAMSLAMNRSIIDF